MATFLPQEISFVFNGRPLTNFADLSIIDLQPTDDTGTMKIAADGSAIFAPNIQSEQHTLNFRLVKGSADDIFINSAKKSVAISGGLKSGTAFSNVSIVRPLSREDGTIIRETVICTGGVFYQNVAITINLEGDTESLVTPYNMLFRKIERILT